MVAAKIRDYLATQPGVPEVEIRQGKVLDVLHGTDADLVVATAQIPSSVKVKVIYAVPLLTGIGAAKVLEEIKEALLA